ncbi:MAG: tetratricopeptide repeat protein [Luteolibacter sp.]
MPMPRIFISSVSCEFRGIRQQVVEVCRQLGYDAVTMDHWAAGHGELRAWLRKEIDSCEGVIHIPGIAYGAEPADHDPTAHGIRQDFHRYSYTQYEFLYADATDKKTWVITPGAKCTRDDSPDYFDLPVDPANTDPAAYQSERRQLQKQWIAYLEQRNFIRHQPEDDKDLQLIIHTLRDHAEEMRGKFSDWQGFISTSLITFEKRQKLTRNLLIASLALLAVAVPVIVSVKKDTGEMPVIVKGQEDLSEQMGKMQEALSQIQQQTDPEQDPISAWSKERLEETLAAQMKVSVEELRKLLASGKTSVDALVQAQALLGSGETEQANEKFDEVIAREGKAMKEKRRRLYIAFSGKAQIAFDRGNYMAALNFRQKAADLFDKESDSLAWADTQSDVTFVHLHLSMYKEAEPLLREILRINEEQRFLFHPKTNNARSNLALLLQATGRLAEAEVLMRRALEIEENFYGKDHPEVAANLNNLALLLYKTKGVEEAEPLFRRVLRIFEDFKGENDPKTAIALNNLAHVLQASNRLAEAEPLMRRALKIEEVSNGKFHPNVARVLNNLAQLLQATERLDEAELLLRRAVSISFLYEFINEVRHPNTSGFLENYLLLVRKMERPDSEARARLEVEREKADLSEETFEELWAEVLAATYSGPYDVTVAGVVVDGQAYEIGIKFRDVILSYGGKKVMKVEELIELTGKSKGDKIPIEILRDGEVLTLFAKGGRLGARVEDKKPE